MALYVPSTSNYRRSTATDDEDTPSQKPIGKSSKDGFYVPNASNYLKVYEQQEEERKERERAEQVKRRADQKKQEEEQKKQAIPKFLGNAFNEVSKIARPVQEGGINILADVGKGISDTARTAVKQTQMGVEITAKGGGTIQDQASADKLKRFVDEDLKSGLITKQQAEAKKGKIQADIDKTKKTITEAEKKTGTKFNPSEGASAFIDTVSNLAGLGAIAKPVFTKAAEAASKRLGRELTEAEAKKLAEQTKNIVPEKPPEVKIQPVVARPVKTDPLDEVMDTIPPPKPTVETPKTPSPMQAQEIETTLFTAAKNQAEQRLGRPLQPQEIDKLTTQTKQVVANKIGSQPTIAEISNANEARPAAQLQKQIEDAYNAGDMKTVETLVPQLPDDLRGSTASALGVKLKPPKPTGDTISGNAVRIEQVALEKKLTEKMGDLPQYKSINMKEQAKEATDLITTNKQRAIDIIDGKTNPPGNLKAQSVHQALEDLAIREGDGALLTRLAKSRINTELSESAQNLRIAAERDPHSAVEQIRQIRDARLKVAERRSRTTVLKEAKNIRKRVDAATPKATKQDWNSFVKELTCR